jgi:hypothetical protein
MKKAAPCRQADGSDCPDRQATCHDTCERYLEWQKRRREERAALIREDAMRDAVEGLHAASIRRTRHGHKRRRGRG